MKSSSRDRKGCSPTLREYMEQYNFRKNLKRSKSKKKHHSSQSHHLTFKNKIQQLKFYIDENITQKTLSKELNHKIDQLFELFDKALNTMKSTLLTSTELVQTIEFNAPTEKKEQKLISMPHLNLQASIQSHVKENQGEKLGEVRDESVVIKCDEFTSLKGKEEKMKTKQSENLPTKEEVGRKRSEKRIMKPERIKQK